MILSSGTIRTMDRRTPVVDAIGIRGDRIVAAPAVDAAAARRVVDLGGRCVLPAFTDAHVHFPEWALGRRQVGLEGCTSLGEALERIARPAARLARGQWLLGHGWRAQEWREPVEPGRADLDRVTRGAPAALWSRDGHTLWLNSAALAVAHGDLPARAGRVEVDAGGEPTGLLREEAAARFEREHIRIGPDVYDRALREAIPVAHARGIAAIHDKDGHRGALGMWQRLHAEGELTLRVWQSLPHTALDSLARLGVHGRLGDDMLTLGYLKVFMDGALGSQTAAMLDGTGVVVTTRAELEEIVLRGADLGWPVAVHAIGDRANRDALDALAATRARWAPLGLRHRIEHAQLLRLEDISRFAELSVAASVQFSHALSDRDLVERHWARTSSLAYPFRALRDAGALLVNGSDAPVEELDPLLGLRSAVARTWDGRPAWRPEQALSVRDAIEAATCNAAWLAGDEERRGRLLPGRLADLVVLDRDPFTCDPEELGSLAVVATMVGGRWVHGAPPWDA